MSKFNWGGSGLPQGRGYIRLRMQSKDRLLLPLGRYRSDDMKKSITYCLWRKAFLIIFCVLFSTAAVIPVFGQEVGGVSKIRPLVIGDTVPEEFWTIEHSFLVGDTVVKSSLEKFRGKLLLLDFWETYCGPCLKNLPKLDSLHSQMKGVGEIVLINSRLWRRGTSTYISQKLEELKSENDINLEMDKIIYDEKLNNYFEHRYLPHYVLIGSDDTVLKSGSIEIFDAIEREIDAHIRTGKHLID